MILWLLGLASAMLVGVVLWWLADGLRALLARRRVEAARRAARTPLELVVTAREDHTADLFSLTLARADGKRLPRFRAGQYLTVCSPQGARRYSLAAWQARPRQYRLGIRRVAGGRVSGWLHEHARPGLRLDVLAPAGDFVLASGAGEVVLVGGGIGVTPMAAMADELEHRRAGRVWLFHAARHEAELIDRARYAALESASHGFRYRPVLSRPDADWTGGRGRLAAADLTRELAAPAAAHYYLCARPAMMDELAAGLVALGVPGDRIHRESFGGAANTDATEYRVAVAGHGEHSFRGEPSLLHALESWGVPIEADCRAGQCGACRVCLVSGQVVQTQPATAALPAGQVLACCCRPAGDLEIAPA